VGWAAALYFFSSLSAPSFTIASDPVHAQKSGGVLKVYHPDSPASMSILEEGTNSTAIPMMGVFNNLVIYDQHVGQNSLASIVPDLATMTGKASERLRLNPRKSWYNNIEDIATNGDREATFV
jgi:peptide/nickel transport system substrate-binding protein